MTATSRPNYLRPVPTVSGADITPALSILISQHCRSVERLEAVLNFADEMHPDYDPQKAAFVKRMEAAHQRLNRQLVALPVRTLADIRSKAAYLVSKRDGCDEDQLRAFVESIG